MAGRNGKVVRPAGSFDASLLTLLRPATMFSSVLARLRKSVKRSRRNRLYQHALILSCFMQCHGKNIRLHTVTAASEREARALLPASRLVFVAVSVSGRRVMFKLLITLINCQNGRRSPVCSCRGIPDL
ncbi:host cell division inhibitor Icd-like protein [Escherichia coli]